MSSKSSSASGGIGFLGMLTILFIGLKLTHFIDWCWLLVLAPLWGGVALTIGCFLAFLLLSAVVTGFFALLSLVACRKRRPFR